MLAVRKAGELLERGASALDAVEAGVREVESDPEVRSVGLGSLPNREGVVELDAAIMDGRTHRAGAVAALRATEHPVSVARAVMERSEHVFLVGEGARKFARGQGIRPRKLITPAAKELWQERYPHRLDTVAVLARDRRGDLAAACSTSGLADKLPGRVGDSPVIGAGLYCDNAYGAAGATGRGELALRVCASHLVVLLMRQGLCPKAACETAMQELVEKTRPGRGDTMAFIALSPAGDYAAAALRPGFHVAVWERGAARLLEGAAWRTSAKPARRRR